MKLKNVLLTAGLTLGVAACASLVANANQAPVETKADGVPSVIYFEWTNCDWDIYGAGIDHLYAHFVRANGDGLTTWHGNLKNDTSTKNGIVYAKFNVPADSAKVVFNVYGTEGWNYNEWEHQTVDLTIPTDGKDTYTLGSRNESTDWRYIGSWSKFEATKYTISKMAVEFVDGVAQSPSDLGLGSDLITEGESHSKPGTVYKNLKHFEGWYTDASCTTEYNGIASVTSDFTIYAKFIRLSVDSYVYWVTESASPAFDHFYAYNEYDVGTWPGESITDDDSYEVHGSMHFNGLEQKIYKIPVPSDADFAFILNNNNDKQTYDIDYIVAGGAYYTWLKDGESKYSWNYNADAASALDFLLDAENVRNLVRDENGAPADYSVCGISPAEAARLYVLYEGLDDEALKMVNNTTTYTYNGTDTSSQTDVYYSAIMAELYNIALKNDDFAANHLSSRISPIFVDADNSTLIIAVAAFTAILATGGFFFLRRRKEN